MNFLGNRIKSYENISRTYLVKKIPVIIRLDGKAFHTLTRGLDKPFDELFINSMHNTAIKLCENVQNCKLAYVQSDEISLLLLDNEAPQTQQWFGGNIQKMVSISAAITSVSFTKFFGKEGIFDSRVFNIPKEEVCNYFIWRQLDAVRNSIQGLGQKYFSHKSLHGLSCNQIQEKLFQEEKINWSDESTINKRGACAIRNDGCWVIDKNIPEFTKDRNFLDKMI